jgi:hypothetical protein
MYFYIFDAIQILIQIGLYTYDFFFGLLCEGVVTNDRHIFITYCGSLCMILQTFIPLM